MASGLSKILLLLTIVAICGGCFGAKTSSIPAGYSARHTSILVVPVTRVEAPIAQALYAHILSEMETQTSAVLIDGRDLNEDMLRRIGVDHPDSFGSLDFGTDEEGARRRAVINDIYGGDLIMFTSAFLEPGLKQKTDAMHIYVQIVDMKTGGVVLNLSVEDAVNMNDIEASTRPLIQNLAREIRTFLRR